MARVVRIGKEHETTGQDDPVVRAAEIVRQREEVSQEEVRIRAELLTRRERLRAQLAEVENALTALGAGSDDGVSTPVVTKARGDVPALIRTILATNAHGLMAAQIARIAEEQGRPFRPIELHSTLSRMVRTGELSAKGKPREKLYLLARQPNEKKG